MQTRVRWTSFELASIGERAAAFVVDAGMFVALWAGGMIWLVETGELGTPPDLLAGRALVWLLIVWLLSLAYDAGSVHVFGSTVGRRIAGIEVRSASGLLPAVPAALRRALVRTPAVLALGAGLLPVRSDRQRRAAHDRLAGTVVVRAGAVEPVAAEREGGLVTADAATALDTNEMAIRRADLSTRQTAWLRAIAEQTHVRLDIADPSWRSAEAPGTVAGRAFCLLLVRLLDRYPEQHGMIARVLGGHDELAGVDGDRERFLTGLLEDPARARRWVGVADSTTLQVVLDVPAAR
jgi:uncharacterized RDD family membrane protein YckC